MPYSVELRDELVNRGVVYFLSKYRVKAVAGGMSLTATSSHNLAGPQQRLHEQLGGFGHLDMAILEQHRDLAPPTHAYFERTIFAPPPPPEIMRRIRGIRKRSVLFKDTVTVYFDTANQVGGVPGLPVYLIPSAARNAVGAKLPVHGANSPDFVFTTTQTGCTFEISGNPAEPFVSHTNARGLVGAGVALSVRIAALQAALAAAGADPAGIIGNDRAQFALYPTPEYEAQDRQVGRVLQQANANEQTYRKNKMIGHSRTNWTVHGDTLRDLLVGGALKPTSSLIVGNWTGIHWGFSYQECGRFKMVETKRRKLGRIFLKTLHQEREGVSVYVVGHFWPGARTETPFPIVDI